MALDMFADDSKLNNSLKRLDESAAEKAPYQVEVLGFPFWADAHVFSPKYFKSTAVITEAIPFKQGERFLEVGTGVGVTAVIAAKKFDNTVTALDINPDAVRLAKKNVLENGVSQQVTVKESDVFSGLSPADKFNTIYWDPPYVYTDSSSACNKMLYRAVCDPGYQAIERFLQQVRQHLLPKGRIFLGFGTNGDEKRFKALLEKYGFSKALVHSKTFDVRGGMTYYLYQIKDKG